MAIGVSSYEYFYKKSEYAFIETTNYSLVGVPPDKLGGNLTLYSDPTIIIISNGKKLYGSGNETHYIRDNYLKSGQKVNEFASQLTSLDDEFMAKQKRISELDLQIGQLRKSDKVKEYNSQVLTFTTLVSIYYSRFASYRRLFTEYEQYGGIQTYIFEHKYDRSGVNNYIKKNMPI